ncbi:hypothetical protein B7P43_G11868 [Cryptotermes secundus]|uniref:Uncharacterized protein n=1 Tax=Cryptotermes secundus TaxID=105785 RepID=A0A2J7QKP4_9NEOP|nr:hypothetical protein B7P43_G11868 [Cryptotermes secundus]
MDLGETEWGGIDWTDLAQDKDKWTPLLNTAINLQVPQHAGKFLGSCTQLVASQEGLSSVKLV